MPLSSDEILEREWQRVTKCDKPYREGKELAQKLFRLLYEHLTDLDDTPEFINFENAIISILAMASLGFEIIPELAFKQKIVPLWDVLREKAKVERTHQEDIQRERSWYGDTSIGGNYEG